MIPGTESQSDLSLRTIQIHNTEVRASLASRSCRKRKKSLRICAIESGKAVLPRTRAKKTGIFAQATSRLEAEWLANKALRFSLTSSRIDWKYLYNKCIDGAYATA